MMQEPGRVLVSMNIQVWHSGTFPAPMIFFLGFSSSFYFPGKDQGQGFSESNTPEWAGGLGDRKLKGGFDLAVRLPIVLEQSVHGEKILDIGQSKLALHPSAVWYVLGT